jgi:hypothetical protein
MKNIVAGCEPYFVASTYETKGYNTHDGKAWKLSSSQDIEDFKKYTGCKHILIGDHNSIDTSWFNRLSPQAAWTKSHDKVKRPGLRLPGAVHADALSGALGMFGSWMRARSLLRQVEAEAGSFDLCYRLRFDLLFNGKICHETIRNLIVGKDLVSPNFCNFSHQGGCNDQLFCSDFEVMNTALAVHENLKEYIINDGQVLHPETTFGYHLKKCGINKVHFPFDFVIKRSHGGTHDLRGTK